MNLNYSTLQRWHQKLTPISILLLIFLSSCSEEPLNVGLELLPEDDIVGVIETKLDVELFTIDGTIVEAGTGKTSLLGALKDDYLGVIEAGFIADFIYTASPSALKSDSLEYYSFLDLSLELIYSDYVGSRDGVEFEIFQLNDPVPTGYTKSDYVLLDHMVSSTPLVSEVQKNYDHVEKNEIPSIISPVSPEFDTTYITLSEDFGQALMNASTIDGDAYDASQPSVFKDLFKGLFFKPELSLDGGMLKIDHSLSKLILRVEHMVKSAQDTTILVADTVSIFYQFGHTGSTPAGKHIKMFNTQLSDPVKDALNSIDKGQENAYIQSLSGPRIRAEIQGLDSLKAELGTSVSVIKAQLVLPFETKQIAGVKRYNVPEVLGIYDAITETGTLLFDDEYSDDVIGGGLDTTATQSQYVFNLGNHIHTFLHADDSLKISPDFFIFASDKSYDRSFPNIGHPYRIVLNGRGIDQEKEKPYIRIVYSVLP